MTYVAWGPIGAPAQQYNDVLKTTVPGIVADLDGYHYTWEASGSLDGVTVKATDVNYPAFYKAAHHTWWRQAWKMVFAQCRTMDFGPQSVRKDHHPPYRSR